MYTCNRCGSTAVSYWEHNNICRIRCGYCDADTGEQKGREKAEAIWNTFKHTSATPTAVADLAEHRSRVLALEELLDSAEFDSSYVRPVWFENRGLFCVPALLLYDLAERELESVRVEWHGKFDMSSYALQNYGKWWRCWSSKPSHEQLDTEAWQSV